MNAATLEKESSGASVKLDPGAAEVLRSAVGAASMLGADKARALLEMPDAQLGSLLKQGISQFLAAIAGLNLDFAPSSGGSPQPSTGARKLRTTAGALDLDKFEAGAQAARKQLVSRGQLLPAAEIWNALGMTRQALNKALSSGRIFTVDVGANQYYPAFYLSQDIDRKTLAKITQLLGTLPGWSKWQFFTTRKGSLGDITPLEALKRGELEKVRSAAQAFVQR